MATASSKTRLNTLAVLVIAGFLAVIIFSIWLSTGSRHVFGPTVLASDPRGHVYLNTGTTLYHLDDQGHLLDKVTLRQLGIRDVHLTDLLVREDGTLLVGSSDRAEIYSCTLQQRQCRKFLSNGTRPESAFKMVWDGDRNRLIVVDGKKHRFLFYNEHGEYSGQSKGGKRHLKYPNTLIWSNTNELVVADTNHHRLVALDADTLTRELWEIPVKNKLGNFRRSWPTDLVQTNDSRYWTIMSNDLLANGDVLLFDTAKKPLKRVDLPADWDPVRMTARHNDVLLAGFASVELVSVSLDGATVQPFGDSAFKAELTRIREQRQLNDSWWRLWIWVALFPLAILAGSAAWMDYRLRQQTGTAAAGGASKSGATARATRLPETIDGIYWLQPKPAIVTMLRQARLAMYALPVLLLIPVLLLLSCCELEKTAGLTGLLLASLLPILLMAYFSVASMGRGRLGVTGDQLVLMLKDGPQKRFFPRQLVYGNNFISSGDITVYTRTGRGPIYDEDEMRNHVQPRLDQARKLGPLRGYLYLLQEGDRLARVTTVGIVYMVGLYACLELFMA